MAAFYNNENHAIKYKRDGYHDGDEQTFLNPRSKKSGDQYRGHESDEHAPPLFFQYGKSPGLGPNIFPEQNNDRQNRARLDDHVEQLGERFTEGQPTIDQNQVARGADGQEFGHALDQTQQRGCQIAHHNLWLIVRAGFKFVADEMRDVR